MKNINRQRKASLRILSLAMVVAVYLNWQYSRTSNDEYIFAEGDTQATNGEVMSETDMLMTDTDYENKNYGDAQLVATTKTDSEKYFRQARLAQGRKAGMRHWIPCKKH